MSWQAIVTMQRNIAEWQLKRKLREMLRDPRSTNGFRSIGQLEKGISADRATTERLLVAIGATKSDASEYWTLAPAKGT